jgi:hypothetical protein
MIASLLDFRSQFNLKELLRTCEIQEFISFIPIDLIKSEYFIIIILPKIIIMSS